MTTLTAAVVITPYETHSPGTVEIDDGRIVAVRAGGVPTYEILAPGFIDLQVNGIADVSVADADGDDWAYLDARLVSQGVTAWCPTLVTAPLDSYAAPLARIAAAAARDGDVPAILGAHLEGPFLGGAPGAHPVDLLRPLDAAWLAALPDIVRMVTLAPELDGAVDVIAALAQRDILVSLGHSTATYEQARAAADAGARMVTHCFNGMGPLHHRQPGLIGAALTDPRLFVGLIADLVHVHAAIAALVFAAKPHHVALVTDAVKWTGPLDDAPRLRDGTLAGSCLTMDQAFNNLVNEAGIVDLTALVRAASTNPARAIGGGGRGHLMGGARADLVALNSDLRVVATWINGRMVYEQ